MKHMKSVQKVFLFFAGQYEENKIDEAFEILLESTRQICAYAAQKGDMPVLCEVFDYVY